MNVKTKMNCKTESYFLIMFSMVGRIWMREGPHATRGPGVENHWFKRSLLSLNLISFFSTPLWTVQNWTIEDWKNVAWSDESRFLQRHSDGRIRIWRKEHESMDPSCLVSMVQAAGGGVMVWGIFFLAHFGPLSTNWALFKCHSLPEYCCWPCPSLYDYSVPIFWWMLPAV